MRIFAILFASMFLMMLSVSGNSKQMSTDEFYKMDTVNVCHVDSIDGIDASKIDTSQTLAKNE